MFFLKVFLFLTKAHGKRLHKKNTTAILPTPEHKRQRTQHLGVVIRLIYAKGLVRTGQMVNRLTFTVNSEERAEHGKIEWSADGERVDLSTVDDERSGKRWKAVHGCLGTVEVPLNPQACSSTARDNVVTR